MIASGKLLIYKYLPEATIKKEIDKLDMEEFLQYVAMADYARKMAVDDLEAGLLKALSKILPDS